MGHSLVRSHVHSLARGKANFWCLKMTWFCPIVQWRAVRLLRTTRFARALAHSRACGKVYDLMSQNDLVLSDSDQVCVELKLWGHSNSRVYSYTKVSPIVLSQEDSPERRISWGEPLLFAQISFIFRYFSAKNIFTFFLHLTGRNKQPNSVSHEF